MAVQGSLPQTVVVTGGASGIGAAIAERFAAGGDRVVIVDVAEAAGQATAQRLARDGGAVEFLAADLADPAARSELVARAIGAGGQVGVLVNNAATVGDRLALDALTEEDWARVLATNLTAAAFLARDAARAMPPGAAIVNVSAMQEHLPLPGHVAYVASKGGLSALTRALAVELAPRGIRVNAVVPACIQSPGFDHELGRSGQADTRLAVAASLLGRFGDPAEVAAAVHFLSSADASFITGAELRVDGGRPLSRRPDVLAVETLDDRSNGSASPSV